MSPNRDDGDFSHGGDWLQYRTHVVAELERLDNTLTALSRKIDELLEAHRRELKERDTELWAEMSKLKVEVAMLQVKSGIWGASAGMLVALTSVLIQFMLRH